MTDSLLVNQVTQMIEHLTTRDLYKVAEYIEFLRFRTHQHEISDEELGVLYAEFDTEDQELANAGMDDYALSLLREDQA